MAKTRVEIQSKYDAAHRKTYSMKLHCDLDRDIIEKLASVPSMMGYIKQLIREDIKRSVPKNDKGEKNMKTYKIKPEYLDMWEGGDTPSDPDRIITEDEIDRLSTAWETDKEELLKQLIPCD